MKIIIEIVLYNKKINDSTTFISLDNHKTIINQLFSQIELLIYDNSSTPQIFDIVNSFSVKYKSNKKNGGVSAAYNYAFDIAKKKNFKWMLLLDQDTELNENYFIELKRILKKIESSKDVVAIVPKIYNEKNKFSPSKVLWGGVHRPIDSSYIGEYEDELMAIGSCTVLRTSFIKSIDGFSRLFWLDCLDRWLFHKIHKKNKSVYILRSKIYHELSILNFNKFMNVKKYHNQVLYEAIFMLKYKKLSETLFFLLRLVRRAIYLFIQTRNINYSICSLSIIIKILFSGFNTSRLIKSKL